MPTDTKVLLKKWNEATGNLSWGVQRTFRDALSLVAEEKITLVHGADYSQGSPCLVNSVAAMLTTGGGHGIPSASFGTVVGLFDRINSAISGPGPANVTPIAAETLLRFFAPEQPEPTAVTPGEKQEVYVEPKDDDMARDWLNAVQVESAIEKDFPCCEVPVKDSESVGQSERR